MSAAATLKIPSDSGHLAEVRAFVRDATNALGAPAGVTNDLVQAVDEAVTNTIVHGYSGEPGTIDLTAELVGDDIVITIEDRAPLFDPTSVPSPDLSVPPQHRRPGGMGVHLIRSAVDSMEHRPRPGGGNILVLTRSRIPRLKEG